MALSLSCRPALAILRRGSCRARVPAISKRFLFGTVQNNGPTCFTVGIPTLKNTTERQGLKAVIDKLRTKTELANPNAHDSAAILVTPGLTRLLTADGVLGDLASFLAGSVATGRFHLLTAVVDRVAPPTAFDGPTEGISILRGRRDDILPQLWQPSPRKAVQEPDAVGALTFGLGDICTTTVPLARTIFQNSRTSTLIVSSFDMSQESTKLVESMEAQTRHISLPVSALAPSASDLQINYYLPMLPLTGPRVVTESFGNIVRGIKIDGKTAPASSELEEAVNKMYSRQTQFTKAPAASVKVFALVTPNSSNPPFENRRPEPSSWLEQDLEPKELSQIVSRNSRYLEEAYLNGGRFYQLLSGGGGWGVKKGLLSLDPQKSHFALSEEEEMQSFFQGDSDSGFAAPGSEIQFFASLASHQSQVDGKLQGFVFGVSAGEEDSVATTDSEAADLVVRTNQFGALSNVAVYVSSKKQKESKLSVPGSRVCLGSDLEGNDNGMFRNFGADVATLGLLGALNL